MKLSFTPQHYIREVLVFSKLLLRASLECEKKCCKQLFRVLFILPLNRHRPHRSLLILNKPTQCRGCRGKLIFHNKFPATARLWACSSLEGLMWQFLIVPQKAISVHYRHHSTEKESSSSHNMHNM